MQRQAAIFTSVESMMSVLNKEAIFLALDMSYADFGFIFFEGGASIGSHVTPPHDATPNLSFRRYFDGKPEIQQWYLYPYSVENAIVFLSSLLSEIQGSKSAKEAEDYIKNLNELMETMETLFADFIPENPAEMNGSNTG